MTRELLVQVADCRSSIEAHSIRILLEANGIPAIVVGDAIQEIGFEPVGVMVHKDNLEIARRVIHEVPAASDILIPAWICRCGEEVDQGFSLCWSCGEPFEDDDPDPAGDGHRPDEGHYPDPSR